MGIKRKIGKTARERLYSKDGIPRYRSKKQELEELQEEAWRLAPKRPRRKMKLMDIPPTEPRKRKKKNGMKEDIRRMERKNRGQ